MSQSTAKEFRCIKCNKLLGVENTGGFEVKCLRCGTLNIHLEGLDEQVIITDPDGKILYTNGALERMTGYTAEEAIGQRPSLWGRQMPPEFYRELWQAIKVEKRSVHVTLKNKRKDGTTYLAELRISPILDAGGEILFFVGCERRLP